MAGNCVPVFVVRFPPTTVYVCMFACAGIGGGLHVLSQSMSFFISYLYIKVGGSQEPLVPGDSNA